MTLSDAREALFHWFQDHGSFSLERDASKLLLITDDGDEEKKACILAALESFMEASVVNRGSYEDTNYYFLIRPFDSMEQNIQLNAQTAVCVSRCINTFCGAIGDNRDWSDPTSITEKDIYNLTNIIDIMSLKKDD